MRVLILTANPKGTAQLRLDEEVREIDNVLRRAKRREEFTLESKWAVRPEDIQEALQEYQPQIVHFSGHGTQEGWIFEDETGQPKCVSGNVLAGLFEIFANQIECVILNGCYSNIQAEAISQHIKYVVGMNQAVSDQAAIKFAVGFYKALGARQNVNSGARQKFEFAYKSGCIAIKLEGIEEDLVPVLLKKDEDNKSNNILQNVRKQLQEKIPFRSTFVTAVGITVLMIVLRFSGFFQASELLFLDIMMRSQPVEEQDDKLLIVKITDKDRKYYANIESPKNSASLADKFTYELLDKLLKHNPRTIGIYNYRYAKSEGELKKLINYTQTDKRLVFICDFPNSSEKEGSDPPLDVPIEQVGLSDFLNDSDKVIRRQIIRWPTPSDTPATKSTECKNKKQDYMDSFSFLVAQKYLSKDGKEYKSIGGDDGIFKSGETVLQPLDNISQGGYNFRNLNAYQIFLNYRYTQDSENKRSLSSIAKIMTIREVLEKGEEKDIKEKIVLIGTPITGFDNTFSTPFSTGGADSQIRGLFIEAQMISQLVNAALGSRPLLKVWDIQYDMLWILCWSMIGAIAVQLSYPKVKKLLLFLTIGLFSLYAICFILFSSPIKRWVPLIPSALAFSSSGFVIVLVRLYHQRKEQPVLSSSKNLLPSLQNRRNP
ncbi:CHASE2 domain-containing protein [Scytonema sp. UIC 10036]|uniref:CHASE2 domain-containing protein n=1 Tax=Scytonema sp. UIC 10036 TaxID=2304196 RepID=UPI0012DA9C8E|nr:CHASE2 domain-containing protein [Scytonema sp. UIC 10036]MUG97312.1 CHASE2 domain-containing protein [Scytonema sp. UIC 10036]